MSAAKPAVSLDQGRTAFVEGGLEPDVEHVALDHPGLRSRFLARPILADRDLPPFDRATMDGIAIRSTDVRSEAVIPISHTVSAGRAPGAAPPRGRAVAIATGAAVPEGLDVVIEKERLTPESLAGHDAVRLHVDDVASGRSIHPRGCDARRGDLLVAANVRVTPVVVAIAATTGTVRLPVRVRPRISILTTGDELRPPEAPLDQDGDEVRIRDGNGPMLAAILQDFGAAVIAVDHVGDDPAETRRALQGHLDRADLVLTVGGVSAGDRDFVPRAASELGLETGGRGVRVQPGRPLSWWTRDGRIRLAGLPGNPVSALVCTHLFIRGWVNRGLGRETDLPWTPRILATDTRPNPHRAACRPASFELDADGRGLVRVAAWNGSGDLPHLVGTHGLVRLPEQTEMVPAGTLVPTLPWCDPSETPTFFGSPTR